MSRKYIDRELLINEICKNRLMSKEIVAQKILHIINEQPTVNVEKVRHGYNKTSMNPVDEFWCSECGFCCTDYTETKYDEDGDYTYFCECEFNYCPHCGAKMDKE